MLNEQQVGRLLARLNDPVLMATLEETEGVLDIRVEAAQKVFLHIALADPEVEKDTFINNVRELLGQFGFHQIEIELDYLPIEVIERIESMKENILSEKSQTQFIAVASGKGGVGKSTVAANLAVALAKQGKKVGLLDADIYGFSIPVLMGETTLPRRENNIIIPVETKGIKMISMDFFVENDAPVIWRGPMLGKMVKMFLEEVNWGDLDYLVIDLPPGTGDIALDIHTLLPQMNELIVTTPHYPAATVATRAGYMAQKNEHRILGVIENMSYWQSEAGKQAIFGTGGGEKVAQDLGVELLAQLEIAQPLHNKDGYQSAIYQYTDSLAATYDSLAKKIVVQLS